jgi:hypothetical protein
MHKEKNPTQNADYTIMRGKLTTILYNKQRMIIVLKGKGRRYIAEEKATYKRHPSMWQNDDNLLWSLLEEHWANSSLETVRPEEVGALTDCTIYTMTADRDDNGELISCEEVYGWRGYCVISEIDRMLESGSVVLDSEW